MTLYHRTTRHAGRHAGRRAATLIAAGAIALASLSGLALARAPLDPLVVDRAAAWLVHVDIEAALKTDLGRFLAKALNVDLPGLADLSAKLAIDPQRDIKGLTIYGAGSAEEEGVAVLVSSSVVDQLHTRLKEAGLADVTLLERPHGTVYAATIGGDRWFASVRPAADADLRIVVLSRAVERLDRAIAVIADPGESLSTAPEHPLRLQARTDAFVIAAAHQAGASSAGSQIARNMKTMHMELGETASPEGAIVFIDVAIDAGTPENAGTMQQIFQGGVAMVQLQARENPAIADVAKAVRVVADGSTLRVTARKAASKVIEAVEMMQSRNEAATRPRAE